MTQGWYRRYLKTRGADFVRNGECDSACPGGRVGVDLDVW
jgi:hypothetical protein